MIIDNNDELRVLSYWHITIPGIDTILERNRKVNFHSCLSSDRALEMSPYITIVPFQDDQVHSPPPPKKKFYKCETFWKPKLLERSENLALPQNLFSSPPILIPLGNAPIKIIGINFNFKRNVGFQRNNYSLNSCPPRSKIL